MKKYKYGKIVNISSIAGRHRSYVSGAHYVSSKAGLIGLTKQLAYESAKYNININAVWPKSNKNRNVKKKTMSVKQISILEKKNSLLAELLKLMNKLVQLLFYAQKLRLILQAHTLMLVQVRYEVRYYCNNSW